MENNYSERMKAVVEKFGTWYEDNIRLNDGIITSRLYPYTSIFSPLQVNSVKIKNRLVMGPMGNICVADATIPQYMSDFQRSGLQGGCHGGFIGQPC